MAEKKTEAGSQRSESRMPKAEESAPIFMLSAADRFDIFALGHVVGLAASMTLDPDRILRLRAKLREFELWEEAHRR